MQKLHFAVLPFVTVASLLASPSHGQNFTPGNGVGGPGAVWLVYDVSNGNYSVTAGGEKITTWEHKTEGLFNCDNLVEGTLPGLLDVCTSDKLFKLDPEGIEAIDFGNILAPGLSFHDITNATESISGSMLPDGGLDRYDPNSPFLWIPEPSSMKILVIGLPEARIDRRRYSS